MLQFIDGINLALFELIGFNLGRSIARLSRVVWIESCLQDIRKLLHSFIDINYCTCLSNSCNEIDLIVYFICKYVYSTQYYGKVDN